MYFGADGWHFQMRAQNPNLLAQFYTIHGQYGGFVVPMVYAFSPNKQAVTYRILLERLLAAYLAVLGLRPCVTKIVTDCEAAVVSVVGEMLSAVTHRLCYFHFARRTIATSRKTAD